MKKTLAFLSIIFLGIILVACGGKKTFTLSFDVNGGSPAIADQLVKENELIKKPGDPSKEGFTFYSWYEKESNSEWEFSTNKITKNTTLVAKWKENPLVEQKVKVSFDIGYQEGTNPDVQEIDKGLTPKKPVDPTREGYIFKGWYLSDDLYHFNTSVNNDITLVARWELDLPEADKVTITFDIGYEGGTNPSPQEILKNTTIEEPTNIKREGYTFLGWHLDGKSLILKHQ